MRSWSRGRELEMCMHILHYTFMRANSEGFFFLSFSFSLYVYVFIFIYFSFCNCIDFDHKRSNLWKFMCPVFCFVVLIFFLSCISSLYIFAIVIMIFVVWKMRFIWCSWCQLHNYTLTESRAAPRSPTAVCRGKSVCVFTFRCAPAQVLGWPGDADR